MGERYELLTPKNKYVGAFFAEEEVKMMEVVKGFVDV